MTDAFTVSELNEFLKIAFDQSEILRDIYIKGEISNFTNHYKTGHYYFTIKDDSSALKAVMFRMYTRGIGFVPEDGMKIIAHGKIDVFVRDGTYSLKVDDIIPEGVGALYVSFEKLKQKLENEGLFSAEHKKPLPKYPSKIGILTSPTGAVIRDIKNVSSRRFPMCELVLYPCSVQGNNAVKEIIQGLRHFEQTDVDLVIIARGGGSLEDFMPFNDEKLAREIFVCEKPVISAVGHETDFTICDFVSDLRAPTPSAAAELALPSCGEITERLDNFKRTMTYEIKNAIKRKSAQLEKLSENKVLSKPFVTLDNMRHTLDSLDERLNIGIKDIITKKSILLKSINITDRINHVTERKKNILSVLIGKTESLSPLAVLSRGYSLVFKDGITVRNAAELKPEDEIRIKLEKGTIEAEVKRIEQD